MAQQNIQNNPQRTPQSFETPMFREIHKNMWLKRISSKKKKERFWVVFCIHDDTDAYLETYTDNKLAVFHKPEWYISLNSVQHVSPTICAHELDYEFVLTFPNETVRLAAPTWEQMLDWVESLKAKLSELRILSPKDNLYSKLPDNKTSSSTQQLLPTRDPNSPLPPTPPGIPPANLPGIDERTRSSSVTEENSLYHHRRRRRSDNINNINNEQSSSSSSSGETSSPASSSINTSANNDFGNFSNLFSGHGCEYEILYLPGPSNRNNEARQLSRTDLSTTTNNRLLERSASCSPRILQPAPKPTCRTLREQQVLTLEKEMNHPTGVKLQLRKKDCISSIGFVDAFEAVWICGWKQKEHPMLYNALHIGDRLMTIEGIKVDSAAMASQILHSMMCGGLYVNLVVKRLPYGKVFVIHRETEGQTLGIIQANNTAIIESIIPDSLAARHGLTTKTQSCDGTSFCNWVLTEINGRPLNLFFKKNQIHDRLNSVGKDISVLVQPLDLIKQIKKQMKSLKNYKQYILQ